LASAPVEGFEFIAHTADLAVRVRALRLDRMFALAAAALMDAITDRTAIGRTSSQTVALDATDLDQLLVEWLHELLFLFETRGLLVADTTVAIEEGDRCRLRAVVHGEVRDPSRHGIKVLVKAVTYHALHIARTDQGYEATIVFDV
jgi:SHS2 domain-containing protein